MVAADFDILDALAAVAEEHDETIALYRPRGVVQQLRRTVLRPSSTSCARRPCSTRCGENFAGEDDVADPAALPGAVRAARADDDAAARAATLDDVAADETIDREAFALRAARIFVEMILRDRLFHADPHPGNVLVETRGRRRPLRHPRLGRGRAHRQGARGPARQRSSSRSRAATDADVADSLLEIVTAPPVLDLDAYRLDIAGLARHARLGGAASTSTSPRRSRT